MKRSKKPTMYEKVLLTREGHDSSQYLRVKREGKKYTFINKSTGKFLIIEDK